MFKFLVSILSVFRVIVLPVQFQDCKMSCDSTALSSMLNDASDYISEQLCDTVRFELGPMSTLPKSTAYYGKNIVDTHDENIHEAVTHSCRAVMRDIDFSKYDNDGDGHVDCVVLLTAGLSEADGTSESNIWPQQNKLSASTVPISINGTAIDNYIIVCELWSDHGNNPRLSGIGTLCHEFGHVVGMVDYYDTDGIASGGKSTAMFSSTALMDEGNLNDEGRTPPYFNAVDCWLLGLGECQELEEGEYVLSPMNGKNKKYLKYETGHEGEFYLFEARDNVGRDAFIGGRGMLVYHIDRSSPTYIDRWKFNQVNCYPDHQCAYIVSSNPAKPVASEAFFPNGNIRDFTSLPLALLDIDRHANGDVSFHAVRPFKSVEINAFQDAAIINWQADKAILGLPCTIIYKSPGHEADTLSMGFVNSATIENLVPDTKYEVELQAVDKGSRVFSMKTEFTTKVLLDDTAPFIVLSTADRNEDGSFVRGSRIPLRVYNIKDATEVKWYLNDIGISTDESGFYTMMKSGKLKAYVTHENGSTSVLVKEITVR
ncbi:MAG: immune inhibitor A [Bacteroidales bacterium]|nr:immune inhibitor A [Bacteroidales bacterium]